MAEENESYELTEEDARGLAGIRSSVGMLADFSKQIGSVTGSQDLENKVRWLDSFMDRVGATHLLVEAQRALTAYTIDTSADEKK